MEDKNRLMICPNCGYIRDNLELKFCEKCGTEMECCEENAFVEKNIIERKDSLLKDKEVVGTIDYLIEKPDINQSKLEVTVTKITKKTKIIIAICALIVISASAIAVCLSSNKISFDKASAKTYTIHNLVCYVPQDWEEYSSDSDDEESNFYVYYNDNGERVAAIGVFHLSDSYSASFWLPRVAEKFDLDEDEFCDISLTGCSEAFANYGEDDGEYSNWYIVKCDQSIFVILHNSKSGFYDKSVFEEILQATEFEMYETPAQAPAVETYTGCDVPDYGIFSGATLTDKGAGGYAGTSGKYIIDYDARYSYNISSEQKDNLEDYFVLLENAGYEMGKHVDGDYWIFKSENGYELLVVDYTEGVLKIYLGE